VAKQRACPLVASVALKLQRDRVLFRVNKSGPPAAIYPCPTGSDDFLNKNAPRGDNIGDGIHIALGVTPSDRGVETGGIDVLSRAAPNRAQTAKPTTMGDKLPDPSRDFSTPTDPPRPGLPRGTLQPSGYSVDRELEADDDYQPGAGFDIDEFGIPTSLEGGLILDSPARPWRSRGIGVDRVLATIVVTAIAAAAAAAVFVAPKLLPEEPSNRPTPRLVGVDAVTKTGDDPLSLNLSLLGTADGGWVMITGLAAGSAVLGGRPLGERSWRVDASHLEDAKVRPPREFTGQMDLVLELRLADGTIADRRSMRLEWRGSNRTTALAPADTRSPAAEPEASELRRALRPEQRQAAALVARGKELLRDGDFSSARLILQRAADAGEADAALTLGSTYDPGKLAQLGIRSQVANVDLARTWYEKAQEFGSTEASSRLKTLPNR
jgi:hypothetical protein